MERAPGKPDRSVPAAVEPLGLLAWVQRGRGLVRPAGLTPGRGAAGALGSKMG